MGNAFNSASFLIALSALCACADGLQLDRETPLREMAVAEEPFENYEKHLRALFFCRQGALMLTPRPTTVMRWLRAPGAHRHRNS